MPAPGFDLKPIDPRIHIVLPGAVFLGLLLAFALLPIDRVTADFLYRLEGGRWAWRDAWLTRAVIHDGGRKLVLVAVLFVLALIVAGFRVQRLRPCRRGLTYVLVSAVVSGLLINILKAVTHMDCPWDLVRYGGDRPFHALWDLAAYPVSSGRCFPAGHASAAYAWFGAYFFARVHVPRYRKPALAAVIILGLVFGLGQQLRGAHFLSHDLWTAALCWGVAVVLAPLGFPARRSGVPPGTGLPLNTGDA